MNSSESNPLKLLVVGKTGVGKSALCNFLFGQTIFESAAGKPVTSFEDNFQSHQFKVAEVNVVVFDTVGIEVTNVERWGIELDKFLNSAEVHGILYVLNASSARIENFEIDLIKKFTARNSPIILSLTHTDVASVEQIQGIRSQLIGIKHLSIVEVCSVQKKLRGGRSSISDEELKTIHTDLASTFLKTSGLYYTYKVIFELFDMGFIELSNAKNAILNEIYKENFSLFNISEWEEKSENLGENIEKKLAEIGRNVEKQANSLVGFGNALDPYINNNGFGIRFDEITAGFDDFNDFDIESINSIREIQEKVNVLEDDKKGFFSKFGAVFSVGLKCATPESSLKKIVEDVYGVINIKIFEMQMKLEKDFKNESWSVK